MERKIIFSVGEYYHLYSRGVDKRRIYLVDDDYKRFVKSMFICNGTKSVSYKDVVKKPLDNIDMGEKIVAIGAYCLMPNHFHILIKEINEGGISKFMSKLLTGYSSYFNIKNERTGSLFESTFKAEHVTSDNYLKYLYSYIHLNPVKLIQSDWKEAGIRDIELAKSHLDNYHYSSYLDYCGVEREGAAILNTDEFPKYFDTLDSMEKEVLSWMGDEE